MGGYEEALKAVVKPFDIATMDSEQLKKKVEELYDVFTNLINDKINLNKRMVEQDGDVRRGHGRGEAPDAGHRLEREVRRLAPGESRPGVTSTGISDNDNFVLTTFCKY